MKYAPLIQLTNEARRADVVSFEDDIAAKTLGERIYTCQSINELADESNIAKMFVLYLSKERDVANEIHRIFGYTHTTEKSLFLVKQLTTENRDVVFSALHLIKLLKEPLTVPYMQEIFNLEDIELSKQIIATLSSMIDPLAVKLMVSALDTTDLGLLHFTIQSLSRRTKDIGWHTFKRLLFNENKAIRREAAFAISIRRSKKSASSMAQAIEDEIDLDTKHALILYSSMIPGKQLLMPLLKIATHDPHNKSRLVASRALYRIQGITPTNDFFRLRNNEDPAIRAEVIARLGQFGIEDDKQKRFIREELAKTDDLNIIQSCVQALGYISEAPDVAILMEYLQRDALTSYNAAFALTRAWRLQDNERVIEALKMDTSPMQRQIFLKFLIHRRGLGLDPQTLLNTVHWLYENDDNINVHYLAALLLKHAPSPETTAYLLTMNKTEDDFFVKEATSMALRNIIKENDEMIISLAHNSDLDQFLSLMQFIPAGKDESFYRELAAGIFDQETHEFDETTLVNVCNHAYSVLLLNRHAMKQFLAIAAGTFWEKAFIKIFHDNAPKEIVSHMSTELLHLLDTDDEKIKILILERLKEVDNPSILPKCMTIAESKGLGEAPKLAREIVSSFGKKGII